MLILWYILVVRVHRCLWLSLRVDSCCKRFVPHPRFRSQKLPFPFNPRLHTQVCSPLLVYFGLPLSSDCVLQSYLRRPSSTLLIIDPSCCHQMKAELPRAASLVGEASAHCLGMFLQFNISIRGLSTLDIPEEE